MSENLRNYTKALYGFDAVVRRVPDDGWEQPSPCEEWKALDVLAHVVGVQRLIAGGVLGDDGLTAMPQDPRVLVADGPLASWGAARDGLLAALDHPGALQTVVATPFGQLPVDQFLGILVLDTLTHTWDVATAAGVDPCLDDDLVARCSENIKPMDAMIRGTGMFADKKEAPEGAGPVDELMAFLGRSV
jgi:uncharacterized protein (TIGR03086 family)